MSMQSVTFFWKRDISFSTLIQMVLYHFA